MSYKVNDIAEVWKSVKGFEGLYEVSNLVNVLWLILTGKSLKM